MNTNGSTSKCFANMKTAASFETVSGGAEHCTAIIPSSAKVGSMGSI